MTTSRSKEFLLAVSILFLAGGVTPATAQYDLASTATAGDYGNVSDYTGEGPAGVGGNFSYPTYNQNQYYQPTNLGRLTPSIGPSGINGLPPCIMDSFVRSAGSSADLIYGDEGTTGPPPYYGFTNIHRIESGIHGETKLGLSTGHRSNLPSAWGADEFLGAEWYFQPGPNGNTTTSTASSVTATRAKSSHSANP